MGLAPGALEADVLVAERAGQRDGADMDGERRGRGFGWYLGGGPKKSITS